MRYLLKIVGIGVLSAIVFPAVDPVNAEPLADLIKAAQKEGVLTAQIVSSAAEESNKIKAAFLKRFGLNIDVKIGFGNESTEFQKAQVAMRAGAAPQFDVMIGEDANHLGFINQGLLAPFDSWQALVSAVNPRVREGKIEPEQLSPAPFTGRSFLFGNRLKVLLYNTKLVSEDQLPTTYADLGNPKHKGKYSVPPWASTWEMGIMVYPKDNWLQIVDAAGRNSAGVLHFAASLERILAGNLPFAQSNSHYYWEVKAKDRNAPLGLKFFKDVTFMNRMFYAVPSRARHPAAGALFALWMTTDEGRLLMQPSYFAENIELGQNDVDIEERKLIAAAESKVVNWFSNPEARAQLDWIVSAEGKKYSESILRALTQRK